MDMQKRNPRIVVLGGGLGGTIAAYELAAAVRGRAELMLISDRAEFSFVPSNPWVAVHWRQADAIQVELAPVMARKGIGFSSVGAKRLHADREPHRAERRHERAVRLSRHRDRAGACLRRGERAGA